MYSYRRWLARKAIWFALRLMLMSSLPQRPEKLCPSQASSPGGFSRRNDRPWLLRPPAEGPTHLILYKWQPNKRAGYARSQADAKVTRCGHSKKINLFSSSRLSDLQRFSFLLAEAKRLNLAAHHKSKSHQSGGLVRLSWGRECACLALWRSRHPSPHATQDRRCAWCASASHPKSPELQMVEPACPQPGRVPQIKKPPMWWLFNLVEAAGIEPASASPLQAVLHT